MTDQSPVASETCTSCGSDIPAGSPACPRCGAPASRRCPACGVQPALADRVCVNCGAVLPTPPVPAPPPEWPVRPAEPQGPTTGGTWAPYGGRRPPGGRPTGAGWTTLAQSPFGAPLSPWWPRAGAMLLDLLVLVIPTLLAESIAAGSITTSSSTTGGDVAVLLAATAVSGLYFVILNGTGRGQTVGNRAVRIGVRDAGTGAVIGLGRSVARWLVRYLLYALVVPGLLNDLWPLWDPQNQTLADKVAGTVMVRLP